VTMCDYVDDQRQWKATAM